MSETLAASLAPDPRTSVLEAARLIAASSYGSTYNRRFTLRLGDYEKDRVYLGEDASYQAHHYARGWGHRAQQEVSRSHAELLREMFGPLPFRPVPLDQTWISWNNGTVIRLARALYEERALPEGTLDRGRMAVLADALEESGCEDEEIIRHCRVPAAHSRGCWVLDMLLGKS